MSNEGNFFDACGRIRVAIIAFIIGRNFEFDVRLISGLMAADADGQG